MGRTKKPNEELGPHAPAWAQRLAQRRKAEDVAHEAAVAVQDWTPTAVGELWAMFDKAVEHANGALDRSGAPERILLHRTMREYRLSMSGPDVEERQITVFASLVSIGGRPSGGALISTSQTRATIYLMASSNGRHMRWTIAPTGSEFTERVVGDLFLSVFSDDPAATMRLTPYFTVSP